MVCGDLCRTVVCIQVLVQRHLEQGGATLSARNGRRGEEVGPLPEPGLAVCSKHLLLVLQPVLVPAVEGRRVVHANDVDGLDFEASTLEAADVPAERAGRVRAGEDVLVHEETPGRREDTVRTRRWGGDR